MQPRTRIDHCPGSVICCVTGQNRVTIVDSFMATVIQTDIRLRQERDKAIGSHHDTGLNYETELRPWSGLLIADG